MATPSRSDAIADLLRDEILRGQYRAGERLPSERDLALRFETSRGAVREAIRRLDQLGLVCVRPGGARIAPVAEASLEAIGHLLALESPPDPVLVDQVLEVVETIMAATLRIGIGRAGPHEIARSIALVDRLGDESRSELERHQALLELVEMFLDASGNMVLRIIRKSLQTHVLPQLLTAGIQPVEAEPDEAERVVSALRGALERRDPTAAAEAVHGLFTLIRNGVRESLEQARTTIPLAQGAHA